MMCVAKRHDCATYIALLTNTNFYEQLACALAELDKDELVYGAHRLSGDD